TLQALGRLGYYFYNHQDEMNKLSKLSEIDWLRANPEWCGRAVDLQGRITINEDAIVKMCNLLKTKLGIELSRDEVVKENEIRK
ncbi:MAG: DNA sulfur modification protein DndB, partial [Clostridia bacterium]|nr:DNA sulfur modification protein DndB [Clostridia bacterium]